MATHLLTTCFHFFALKQDHSCPKVDDCEEQVVSLQPRTKVSFVPAGIPHPPLSLIPRLCQILSVLYSVGGSKPSVLGYLEGGGGALCTAEMLALPCPATAWPMRGTSRGDFSIHPCALYVRHIHLPVPDPLLVFFISGLPRSMMQARSSWSPCCR